MTLTAMSLVNVGKSICRLPLLCVSFRCKETAPLYVSQNSTRRTLSAMSWSSRRSPRDSPTFRLPYPQVGVFGALNAVDLKTCVVG